MPTDLKILLAFVVFFSVLFALMAVAEYGRFTPPRHRRPRPSTSELRAAMAQWAVGVGWVLLGLLALAIDVISDGAGAARRRIVRIGAIL